MSANASFLIHHPRLILYFNKPSTSILHLRQNLSFRHLPQSLNPSIYSSFSVALFRSCRFSRPSFSLNPRKLSSSSSSSSSYSTTASAEPPSLSSNDNGGGGRSGALSSPPVIEVPQKIDVNPPKGTRDFPPEDMRLRSWLFQNFREVSRLFGFEEVDFPVLESEALFVRKAGEEIRDQLYNFEDRGNRRVALRPELTPSLARLVIQKGKSVSLPLKWFAIGQCWRYERMTRGRRREHYQWNMDIIGVPEVTAEAELISSIVTFFKRLGITASDVGFKVSSRKVLQEVLRCYSIPENMFGKVCIIIDKIEKIPIEEIKGELVSVGISEAAIEELLQVLSVKSLDKLEEILGDAGDAVKDLKQLFSLAEKFGYSDWIQFDASVVRGLAYYTGIVFEGFDREGKLRAICGGGRYDQLLSTFGGDDIPACGFGFGDAVIVELIKEKGLLPELSHEVENIVCPLDKELQGAAATVATILRQKGQSVDLVLENKPLKWVFKRAARINAGRLILVGNSEWQKGMVTGGNQPEDGEKNPASIARGGIARSWGTTFSGQSVSTSGSAGSPSSRSELAMATPASENTFVRLNHLDIHGDDSGSQGAVVGRKKKRGQRAVGGDKTGRGLRQFSMKVCEKVESKGRTTYNEVADELVAEFADPSNSLASPDQQQYDEKNIRRRVYDALNVLMAMDIISKDKKEIQWKGLPRTSVNDIEELKAERIGLRSKIEKKAAYLQELEEQFIGLQNLIQRNEQLYGSGNAPTGGVALPFILVQTRPHATVEVEISEDMQLVHFDFNSTPFELHDDNYVLKAMRFCERPQGDDGTHDSTANGGEGSSMLGMYQSHIPHPTRSTAAGRPPSSPPLPGILKARVKHEH